MAHYCSWAEPLNMIIIILSIALIGYGAFLIYKGKKEESLQNNSY